MSRGYGKTQRSKTSLKSSDIHTWLDDTENADKEYTAMMKAFKDSEKASKQFGLERLKDPVLPFNKKKVDEANKTIDMFDEVDYFLADKYIKENKKQASDNNTSIADLLKSSSEFEEANNKLQLLREYADKLGCSEGPVLINNYEDIIKNDPRALGLTPYKSYAEGAMGVCINKKHIYIFLDTIRWEIGRYMPEDISKEEKRYYENSFINFTVAHEIGHLKFDYSGKKNIHQAEEMAANLFAYKLLEEIDPDNKFNQAYALSLSRYYFSDLRREIGKDEALKMLLKINEKVNKKLRLVIEK